MRWNVEIEGLDATQWTILDPNPMFFVAGARGYFDALNNDGDGKIALSEVLTLEGMIGIIYPSPADQLLHFAYDADVGLSYQIDGYHYRVAFGQQAAGQLR